MNASMQVWALQMLLMSQGPAPVQAPLHICSLKQQTRTRTSCHTHLEKRKPSVLTLLQCSNNLLIFVCLFLTQAEQILVSAT